MAYELKLDGPKLIRSAKKEWCPAPVEIGGLKQISSVYGDMIVNAYVVWDEDTKNALIFDTGTDEEPIMAFLEEEKLKIDAIFLTHTHRDHISCLGDLCEKTGNPKVFVHQLELLGWMRTNRRRASAFHGFALTYSQTYSWTFIRRFNLCD